MIFMQALARAESPAGQCLLLFEQGVIELLVSPRILSEIDDVLRRPILTRKFPALTDAVVDALLENLIRNAMLVFDVPKQVTYQRDPKDEPYFDLALITNARYLVSRDNDLLDLSSMESQRFRSLFPFLTILDPVSLLNEIELMMLE